MDYQNSIPTGQSASPLLRHVPQRASSGAICGNHPSDYPVVNLSVRARKKKIILLFARCQPVNVLCSSTQVGLTTTMGSSFGNPETYNKVGSYAEHTKGRSRCSIAILLSVELLICEIFSFLTAK